MVRACPANRPGVAGPHLAPPGRGRPARVVDPVLLRAAYAPPPRRHGSTDPGRSPGGGHGRRPGPRGIPRRHGNAGGRASVLAVVTVVSCADGRFMRRAVTVTARCVI